MLAKYRFGVMSNGRLLKAWQVKSIERLLQNGHHLDLIIENHSHAIVQSKWKRYLGEKGLYNFYNRLFLQDDLSQNFDCSILFSKANIIKVNPIQKGKYSQYFEEIDVDLVKSFKLDFILRFGFNIIRGEILHAALYGVWSFHHDDEEVIRGGPPGFWEIYEGHDINGLLLQRLTNNLDNGIIIRKSYLPVINHSYKTHYNELLRNGIEILIFAVENLNHFNGKNWKASDNTNVKIYRSPSNIQMVSFVFKLIKNRISFNFYDLFRHEKWNIGIIKQSFFDLIESKKLLNPFFYPSLLPNQFLADPFIVVKNENLQLFFENYSYTNQKGLISKTSYNIVKQHYTAINKLIEKPFHLAFPFYYKNENGSFLLAESSLIGKLIAYKLNQMYDSIESEEEWLDTDSVDSVIFNYNNHEWLFCTKKSQGTNLNLFAYYRSHSSEKWNSHHLNPIISDARKARMAGNIIAYNNYLYRPAQKNNVIYGEKIGVYKIEDLSPDVYRESEFLTIEPTEFQKFNKGIHTLSYSNGFMAIDAKTYVFVPIEFWRRLKKKIKK